MMKPKTPKNKGPKVFRRYVRRREAVDAAMRFRTAEDGTRYLVRFTFDQRIQHWLLLISFTILAVTGLAQSFESTAAGSAILLVLGGIDSARQIHHVAAFVFGVEAIYHLTYSIYEIFVYRRISRIWPDWSDFTNLIEMLKLNVGLSHRHPQFDRFNFEEKAEYWALIWGTVVMGVTGLMQWFPIQVTNFLPGWMIPVARAFHHWEAILAVLSILTWHFYHTLIKTRNFSIFSGVMTMAQMQEEHPLELAYLEHAAKALETSRSWPALVEFSLQGEETPVVVPQDAVKKVVGKEQINAALPVLDDGSNDEESASTNPKDAAAPKVEDVDQSHEEKPVPPVAKESPATKSLSSGEA